MDDYFRDYLLSRRKPKVKKWLGGSKCDVCGKEVANQGGSCYDSPTFMGQWAFMCSKCYMFKGLAMGQEYCSQTLIKIRDIKEK